VEESIKEENKEIKAIKEKMEAVEKSIKEEIKAENKATKEQFNEIKELLKAI
jgi:hypothetical protein